MYTVKENVIFRICYPASSSQNVKLKWHKCGPVEWHMVLQRGTCKPASDSWFRCQLWKNDSSVLTHFWLSSVSSLFLKTTDIAKRRRKQAKCDLLRKWNSLGERNGGLWCLSDRASLWQLKNKIQLDSTCYFIVLLIGSTFFGHCYADHQELATIILITKLVVSFLGCCMLEVRCG